MVWGNIRDTNIQNCEVKRYCSKTIKLNMVTKKEYFTSRSNMFVKTLRLFSTIECKKPNTEIIITKKIAKTAIFGKTTKEIKIKYDK
jgi:hypothetical protein